MKAIPLPSHITDPTALPSRRVHINECLLSHSRSSVKSNPWELFSRRTKRQFKDRRSGQEGRRALNRIMHVRSLELIEHATITIPRGRQKGKKESCYRARNRGHRVSSKWIAKLGGCILLVVGMKRENICDRD